VELFEAGPEHPTSRKLRYAVSAVALVLLLSWGIWFFFLRYSREKQTVKNFMDAVAANDMPKAYHIWNAHTDFTLQDFIRYWGPNGFYSPIKTYRLERAEQLPNGSSGVVVTVEISGYEPFPTPQETIKFAQNREVSLWVEKSDQSLSFPPP